MSEFTKGEWEKVIFATDELKPLNLKERYLEFCEKCWDLTQKHGDSQKDFWGVRRAGKNEEDTVIIALCGNGPDGRANADLIASAPTLKQQRNDLLTACKKGVAPFSLSQYAEKFKELADKPNLAVYQAILGNAAGMFEILESEAKNREVAIAKCEKGKNYE